MIGSVWISATPGCVSIALTSRTSVSAGHQAIRIQYDHMVIAGAEPLDPVFNVAGFSRDVLRPVPIENIVGLKLSAKPQEAFLLGDPDGRIGGVAQHIPVKPGALSGPVDGFVHRPQASHDAAGIFIVGRQQHGVAAAYLWKRRIGIDTEWIPGSKQQHRKSGQRGHERERNPGE